MRLMMHVECLVVPKEEALLYLIINLIAAA